MYHKNLSEMNVILSFCIFINLTEQQTIRITYTRHNLILVCISEIETVFRRVSESGGSRRGGPVGILGRQIMYSVRLNGSVFVCVCGGGGGGGVPPASQLSGALHYYRNQPSNVNSCFLIYGFFLLEYKFT